MQTLCTHNKYKHGLLSTKKISKTIGTLKLNRDFKTQNYAFISQYLPIQVSEGTPPLFLLSLFTELLEIYNENIYW